MSGEDPRSAGSEEPAPGETPDLPPAGADWDAVPEQDDGTMGLVDHLEELRARILVSLAALFVGAVACWGVSDRIVDALRSAAPRTRFVFLNPAEAFFTYLKVSFYSGLILAAPVVIFQAWQFLRPALTTRERFMTRALFPFIVLFFAGGVAFAFFVILPLGLEFLLGFAGPDLEAMLSINAYATFVLTFLLVFGITFELPVVLFFANRMGLVDARTLRAFRPHFVVGCVTVSALLTPPDVISQVLLAVPVWGLYELTLLLIGVLPDAGK